MHNGTFQMKCYLIPCWYELVGMSLLSAEINLVLSQLTTYTEDQFFLFLFFEAELQIDYMS